uniref:Uncharacterized protein n=1 Tax=Amphimedon queenslandica TaxID=400682 RepID=A0A1X7UI97_AMPQE
MATQSQGSLSFLLFLVQKKLFQKNVLQEGLKELFNEFPSVSVVLLEQEVHVSNLKMSDRCLIERPKLN